MMKKAMYGYVKAMYSTTEPSWRKIICWRSRLYRLVCRQLLILDYEWMIWKWTCWICIRSKCGEYNESSFKVLVNYLFAYTTIHSEFQISLTYKQKNTRFIITRISFLWIFVRPWVNVDSRIIKKNAIYIFQIFPSKVK